MAEVMRIQGRRGRGDEDTGSWAACGHIRGRGVLCGGVKVAQ